MTTPAGVPTVVDVPAENRLVINQDGQEAELDYEVEDGHLAVVHTEVPEELQGRGLAELLVRTAVERAARDHLKLLLWCPFARRWLRSHPEAISEAGVEVDWNSQPD
jgi:uncharacterized protein